MRAEERWRRWSGYWVPRERRIERWFLDHLLAPHGRRERLLVRLLGGTRAAAPVLLRRTAEEAERHARGALAAALAVAANGDGSGAALDGAGWILALPGAASPRRMVALGFAPGEAEPRCALKAAWRPAYLDREAEALSRLRSRLPEATAASLPGVVRLWRGEPEVLAMAALPGRSVYVEVRRARDLERAAARHLAAAARWLTELQAAVAGDHAWTPPPWAELAPEPLRDRPEPWWLGALRRRLASAPLPTVTCHGDYWARNVLLDGEGRVRAVVDWEHAREGSPLADAMHFAFGYAQLLGQRRRLDPRAAFRAAFVTPTALSRQVARFAAAALAPHGPDAELRLAALRLHLLDGAAGRLPGSAGLATEAWLGCYQELEEGGECAFCG